MKYIIIVINTYENNSCQFIFKDSYTNLRLGVVDLSYYPLSFESEDKADEYIKYELTSNYRKGKEFIIKDFKFYYNYISQQGSLENFLLKEKLSGILK